MSRAGSDEVRRLLENASQLPSMPAVAAEILRLTRNPDSTVDEFAAALSLDPALSGKVLKLANSSLFSPGSPVTTLQRATMLMGMKTIKLMALSFSLVESLPSTGAVGFDFREYWRRSVVCAVAARAFGEKIGSRFSDEAFLCGLLCRIGQLVLGYGHPDRYADVLRESGGRWPSPEHETTVLGFDGFEVGAALLESWSLPALIVDCVRCAPDLSPLPDDASQEARELAPTMRLALLCEELVCGRDLPAAMKQLLEEAQACWGADPPELDEFLTDLDASIAETADMLEVKMRSVRMGEVLREAHEQLAQEGLAMASEIQRTQRRADLLEMRNERLLDQANHDPLTGLPNRACFDETLERCVGERRTEELRDCLGLLLIDVDHFKSFNDEHGHQTGDAVLRMVARAIRSVMREEDLAARYGGDEFGAVLPRVSPEGLASAAERIRAAVRDETLEVEGTALSVAVTVGGAWVRTIEGEGGVDRLVESADRFLYRAKRDGRDCCAVGAGDAS